MSSSPTETCQLPSPPRVVAISGVVFSALYITSLVLVRLAMPADPKEPGIWLTDPTYRNWVGIALNLVPFAGIAFLWYMAVLRNRIGLRKPEKGPSLNSASSNRRQFGALRDAPPNAPQTIGRRRRGQVAIIRRQNRLECPLE